jgi:hypothetical protein
MIPIAGSHCVERPSPVFGEAFLGGEEVEADMSVMSSLEMEKEAQGRLLPEVGACLDSVHMSVIAPIRRHLLGIETGSSSFFSLPKEALENCASTRAYSSLSQIFEKNEQAVISESEQSVLEDLKRQKKLAAPFQVEKEHREDDPWVFLPEKAAASASVPLPNLKRKERSDQELVPGLKPKKKLVIRKRAQVVGVEQVPVALSMAQRSKQTLELLYPFASANDPSMRRRAWSDFLALGSCQWFNLNRDRVEVRAVLKDEEHYELIFFSDMNECLIEKLECHIEFVGEGIRMGFYNDEAFLLNILKQLSVKWDPEEIECNWLLQSDWLELKARMTSDQSTEYSQKLMEILNGLFLGKTCRRPRAWIDCDPSEEGKPPARYVRVTYEYRPFHFQLVKSRPERLALPKNSKMLSLYFWEEDAEAKLSLLLQVNMLLDRPLMEIYSVAKGATISGSESLNIALELQSMLGASAYLFDDAKVYSSVDKQAIRLLVWRSLSSRASGFYESRGFRPINLTLKVSYPCGTITLVQKVDQIFRARIGLASMPFSELAKVAKEPDVCVFKAATVLEVSPEICSHMRVQEVADRFLRATQLEDEAKRNAAIGGIHAIEESLAKGVYEGDKKREPSEVALHYGSILSGQFFVRPGYRELLPNMPWSFS